jgi:hypothetical protein
MVLDAVDDVVVMVLVVRPVLLSVQMYQTELLVGPPVVAVGLVTQLFQMSAVVELLVH